MSATTKQTSEQQDGNSTPPPPSSPRVLLPSEAAKPISSAKTTFLTATTMQVPENSLIHKSQSAFVADSARTPNRTSLLSQRAKSSADSSTGSLLRSLELRFQMEGELLHVVDKLRSLHDKHTVDEFHRKIHELEKFKLTVHSMREKLDEYEAKNAGNLRKIADLEQDKAAQLVEIMKLREKALNSSQADQEERTELLKEKDEEIQALNEHLRSLEVNLSQAKTHVKEYRERCEKAEVQMHRAIDGMKTLEASVKLNQDKSAGHVQKIESQLADAEEYRSTVNFRLTEMEDEVSSLNSTILKLKGELNRSNILLDEEKKKSQKLEESVKEANETLSTLYSSTREQRSDEVKSREELEHMKREVEKLKSRDKARL